MNKQRGGGKIGLSRNNIAYDFHVSPHRLEVPYEDQTLCYVFSSDLYKRNFYDRHLENREKISESLTKRFGFNVEHELLCDLKLYSSIEKRGFLIIEERTGQEFLWLDNLTLDGGRLTKRT